MQEALRAIIEDIAEDIREYYVDTGVMQRIKMRFPKSDHIRQMTDYFIRYDIAMIEQLGGETDAHERKIAGLRWAGQDRAGDGDGKNITERAGIFNQPEIWDPYP